MIPYQVSQSLRIVLGRFGSFWVVIGRCVSLWVARIESSSTQTTQSLTVVVGRWRYFAKLKVGFHMIIEGH